MTVSTRRADAMASASHRKTKVGRVVSDKMDKTIVVAVERLARHPVYKRVMRVTTKFKAHDEDNTAQVGDRVLIEESRPISREKRWRLVEVLGRAGRPIEIVAEEPETTEAISSAAHPGRRAKEEAAAAEATDAAAQAETEGVAAPAASPSDAEGVTDAGASPSGAERPQAKRAVAAEAADGEKPTAEATRK
jgi:small subunit ribosomal protein S17